jgi:hypothetical protein
MGARSVDKGEGENDWKKGDRQENGQGLGSDLAISVDQFSLDIISHATWFCHISFHLSHLHASLLVR